MNEYLNKLRKLLEKNHYEDVDSTMEYYEELFADKREAGESDEDILREMDDVEKVAEEILGKRLIDIEDDNKKGIILNNNPIPVKCFYLIAPCNF